MSGRVVHFEIPVDDLERAQEFYREAFGWTIGGMPGLNYSTLSTTATDDRGMPAQPGAINGGMFRRDGGPLTGPLITIETDDIDAALATVARLGGAVTLGRSAVGDMGFAAYFTDCEGNIIGLWENART